MESTIALPDSAPQSHDSIFQPVEGDGSTFAQMSPEDKNRISHRGRAVAQLVAFLNNQ